MLESARMWIETSPLEVVGGVCRVLEDSTPTDVRQGKF